MNSQKLALDQDQMEAYAHSYMKECKEAAFNAYSSATEHKNDPFFISVEDCAARADVAYSHGKRYFVVDRLAEQSARGYLKATQKIAKLHAANKKIPEDILDL